MIGLHELDQAMGWIFDTAAHCPPPPPLLHTRALSPERGNSNDECHFSLSRLPPPHVHGFGIYCWHHVWANACDLVASWSFCCAILIGA